jgi:hypothetical protein
VVEAVSWLIFQSSINLALEFIPHPPHGQDVLRLAGVDFNLFSQAADMHRDRGWIGVKLIVPNVSQQLGARKDLLGMLGEMEQEIELFCREHDGTLIDFDYAGNRINPQTVELDRVLSP